MKDGEEEVGEGGGRSTLTTKHKPAGKREEESDIKVHVR